MTPEEVASIPPEPPASASATNHDVAIAAYRAAQGAMLNNLWVPERVQQAADEKFAAAYRSKFGDAPVSRWGSLAAQPETTSGEGPVPTVGTTRPTPTAPTDVGTEEQIRDRIATIRAAMAKEPGDTPRLKELVAQMEGEYKLLHHDAEARERSAQVGHTDKGDVEPATSSPPLALPAVEGRAYDSGVLEALSQAVASPVAAAVGLDATALQGFVARGNDWLATGYRPDPAQVDAKLSALWGTDVDARVADAKAALDRFFPDADQRERVDDYLERTGLTDDVSLIMALADVGARLRQASQ